MDILSTYSTGGRPDSESEKNSRDKRLRIPPFYRASIMGYRSEIQLLFPTKEPKAYKYQHEWPHFRAAPSVNHTEFSAELSGWYPEHPGLKGPFTLSPKISPPLPSTRRNPPSQDKTNCYSLCELFLIPLQCFLFSLTRKGGTAKEGAGMDMGIQNAWVSEYWFLF